MQDLLFALFGSVSHPSMLFEVASSGLRRFSSEPRRACLHVRRIMLCRVKIGKLGLGAPAQDLAHRAIPVEQLDMPDIPCIVVSRLLNAHTLHGIHQGPVQVCRFLRRMSCRHPYSPRIMKQSSELTCLTASRCRDVLTRFRKPQPLEQIITFRLKTRSRGP